MTETRTEFDSPWPHRVAVLLVCATFPLIWVGGLVTTTKAGMAVPDWPNTRGQNMFLFPWPVWLTGPWDLFIEHGHRLLGALVGMLTIALLASVWFCDGRRWMRNVGISALVLVCLQGSLGGLRVLLDARTLANLHGCLGPAFFGLCVAMAVFTSRRWKSHEIPSQDIHGAKLRRLSILTTVLAYVQLVLGAQVRHVTVMTSSSGFRALVLFHLLMAAVLLVHVVLLLIQALRRSSSSPGLQLPAIGLTLLVSLQLILGPATWVVKYGWPAWLGDFHWAAAYTISADSFFQALTITAHVATGSLVLAFALLVALRSLRLLQGLPEHTTVRGGVT